MSSYHVISLSHKWRFSLVAVNGFITEEGLTTLMIGFYEKMTGETFEQQDVEEDVEVSGSNQGQIKGQI